MFWMVLYWAGWIPHPWDHFVFIGAYFHRTCLQFLSFAIHMELVSSFHVRMLLMQREKKDLPAIPCSFLSLTKRNHRPLGSECIEVDTQTVSSSGQKFWYSLIQIKVFQSFKTLRHPLNCKYPTVLTISTLKLHNVRETNGLSKAYGKELWIHLH